MHSVTDRFIAWSVILWKTLCFVGVCVIIINLQLSLSLFIFTFICRVHYTLQALSGCQKKKNNNLYHNNQQQFHIYIYRCKVAFKISQQLLVVVLLNYNCVKWRREK